MIDRLIIAGQLGKVVGVRRDFRHRTDRYDVLTREGRDGGGGNHADVPLEWAVVPVTNLTTGQNRCPA